MIKLFVKDYCHNCPEFEPEVTKDTYEIVYERLGYMTDIFCKHAARCDAMTRFLEMEKKCTD